MLVYQPYLYKVTQLYSSCHNQMEKANLLISCWMELIFGTEQTKCSDLIMSSSEPFLT